MEVRLSRMAVSIPGTETPLRLPLALVKYCTQSAISESAA
jgi:hypothetical protein